MEVSALGFRFSVFSIGFFELSSIWMKSFSLSLLLSRPDAVMWRMPLGESKMERFPAVANIHIRL
jgi:hypothetical protein